MSKLLTIGMATLNDYEGCYHTLQALRMYHGHIVKDCQLLVIDNMPDSPQGKLTKKLTQNLGDVTYIPFDKYHATTVKGKVFEYAEAPYTLCMDSHVMLTPGALSALVRYFRANPDTVDLIHGPILWDHLGVGATHQELIWSDGMWGKWSESCDERGLHPRNPAFEIPSHGTGLFACRTEAWVGFHPAMRGFGGEEGYLQEKFRQHGGRILCLPALRWIHRFNRVDQMRIHPTDKLRNYLLGFLELGLDVKPLLEHFMTLVSKSDLIMVMRGAYKTAGVPLNIEHVPRSPVYSKQYALV